LDASEQRAVCVGNHGIAGSLLLLAMAHREFFQAAQSHGQQLERWQQETGPAIARRLLIASMACVVVWQLQADSSPQACEFKSVLVRLSGRQMKWGRPYTAPALLAGLWTLLSMLSLLDHTTSVISNVLPR